MKILLNICCGPCAIYPVEQLRQQYDMVMGFFYPHNIHPYTECLRRRDTLAQYAADVDLRMIYQEGYDLEKFLRTMAFRESQRCLACYHDRLRATALLAKRGKFDAFTTTLLYSKFQRHDDIHDIGLSLAKRVGVPFYYEDFRTGWKYGIAESKARGMYRQQYCGCIYSEKERYYSATGGN
jgi:predicted adenine nucleotide alpha hydrolase (AANH) superfamily ATPase